MTDLSSWIIGCSFFVVYSLIIKFIIYAERAELQSKQKRVCERNQFNPKFGAENDLALSKIFNKSSK